MFVGAYWSVLKPMYLLPHNRPQVDLVVFVNDITLIPKFKNVLSALNRRMKKQSWWKTLMPDLKKELKTPLFARYTTNVGIFTCSCPSWIRIQFLFWNDVIGVFPFPKYEYVTIMQSYPFINVHLNKTTWRGHIDKELHRLDVLIPLPMKAHARLQLRM